MAVFRSYAQHPTTPFLNPGNLDMLGFFGRFGDPTGGGTRMSSVGDGPGDFFVLTGFGLGSTNFGHAPTGTIRTVERWTRTDTGALLLLATLDLQEGFITLFESEDPNTLNPLSDANIERMFGLGDRLGGNGADNTLAGRAGDDSVYGYGGNDYLSGDDRDQDDDPPGIEAGNDVIVGGDGNDALDGGLGNDLIWAGRLGQKRASSHDEARGGGGDDFVQLVGVGSATGGDGRDSLYGGVGSCQLVGGNDDDSISGGDSSDGLFGEGGADVVLGGGGDDDIYGDIAGTADADPLNGADDIFGGDGHDVILGQGGNDSLFGGRGNDMIGFFTIGPSSEQGDDRVFGGEGRDTIAIGQGNDTLFGGAGYDEFKFDQFFGTCTIADFQYKRLPTQQRDHLLLRGHDLGEAETFDQFKAACRVEFSDSDRLVYDFGNDGQNVIVFEGMVLANLSPADILFIS